ncbi:hypothetical protein, partial [Endozoicomonas sp. YOMI1]|uniref:hypothetical protein n=1 Tax=Endozoicomonas sp. YOMI1 TaxID=2828739 RepID=UPI0021493303
VAGMNGIFCRVSGLVQQAHVVGLVFRCAPNQPQMRALGLLYHQVLSSNSQERYSHNLICKISKWNFHAVKNYFGFTDGFL